MAEEWSGFLQTLLRYTLYNVVIYALCGLLWCIAVPICFRNRFDSPHHLQLVRLLLAVLSENGDIVEWMKLYKAVWSHSQFMPVISNERDERTKGML